MNLEKMLKSSGVRLPRQKQREIYANGELMVSELESEMVHYVKQESERVSGFHRLVLFWIYVPLLIFLVSLSMLMVAFAISVMFVKDWLVGLTRLCWGVCYRGLKKVQGILKK